PWDSTSDFLWREMADKRFILVHWDESEVDDLALPLRLEGCLVDTESHDSSRALRLALADPPDAILIFLSRDPARGRELARTLTASSAAAHVPIVFVGGSDQTIQETRHRFPDALYVDADRMCDLLKGLLKIAE
nr:hypothetical protein [Actinomycetota bacterium]